MQHVCEGFDSTKSHPTDRDVLILLIFTGQLVLKLVYYISIKQYVMIGFTTRKKKTKNKKTKKTNYPYASQTPIIVQHKQ